MAAELIAALDAAVNMPRDVLNIIASYGQIKIYRDVLYDERENRWSLPCCRIDGEEYLTYQYGSTQSYGNHIMLEYAILRNAVVQFSYEDSVLYITDLNDTIIKTYPTKCIYCLFVVGNKMFTEYSGGIQISTLDDMQIIPGISKKTIERLKFVNEHIIITAFGAFVSIYDHEFKRISQRYYAQYEGSEIYTTHPERSDAVLIHHRGNPIHMLDINTGVLTAGVLTAAIKR